VIPRNSAIKVGTKTAQPLHNLETYNVTRRISVRWIEKPSPPQESQNGCRGKGARKDG